MVNPGSFQGSRKEFLMGEKPAYRAGVQGGYAADALAAIQRRYFKRFPVDLPHEEEPSAEHLASVDDDAPDDELSEPDKDALSQEEYAAAMQTLETRRQLVTFRKGQIKRWQAYQFMKDSDMDPKESGAHNPYRVLLHKLTNVGLTRPRLMNAANLWRKTHRAEVEAEAQRRIRTAGTTAPKRNQLTTFRDKVARDLFAALDQEDRDYWAVKSKEEHEIALEQWKKEIESRPSQDPADRQRCIQGLVKFMQPILDIIGEATGWSATLIAGGPEPAAGGRLSIISVHSGVTTGDVKMNFGRAERSRYKTHIVPIYSAFLRKCYSIDECRARALPAKDEFDGLAGLDFDADGANFDSVSTSDASSTVAGSEDTTMSSPTAVNSESTSSTAGESPGSHGALPSSPPAATSSTAATTALPNPPAHGSTLPSPANGSTLPSPANGSILPSPANGSTLPSPANESPRPSPVHRPSRASPVHVSPPASPVHVSPPASPVHVSPPASPVHVSPPASPAHRSAPASPPALPPQRSPPPSPAHGSGPASTSLAANPIAPGSSSVSGSNVQSVHLSTVPPPSSHSTPGPNHPVTSNSAVASSSSHSDAGVPPSQRTSLENRASPEVPTEQEETGSTPTTVSSAEKPNRTECLAPGSGSRKRPNPRISDIENDQPLTKRLRSSAAAPASARPKSTRKSLTKPSAKPAAKPPASRPHNQAHSAATRPLSSLPGRRKGTISIIPVPPIIDEVVVDVSAPKWFVPIFEMFRSEDLGSQWSSLVSRWALFEARERYDDTKRLSAKRRPAIIGDWIRRARPPTWRPTIQDISEYEEECRVWWTTLQPKWRVSDEVLVLDAEGCDWEALRCPGVNGIVSILAALFYWGIYITEEGDSRDMWDLLVLDCNRVFVHLLG